MAIRKKRKKKSEHDNNWAARSRLRRIEYLLWWRGWVRRGDLMRDFGISIAQTSSDLQRYHTLNPEAMTYNLSSKRYEASARMVCKLFEPSLEEAVNDFLAGGMAAGGVPFAGDAPPNNCLAVLELPLRRIDRQVARRVMIALLGEYWIKVKYHSLGSGTVGKRKLAPGGLAFDGTRWHLRAFCEERKEWLDFVLGRMATVDWPADELPTDLPKDEDWHTMETVSLAINPALSPEQQEALRMDYGISGKTLDLRVRKAMKSYLLAHLHLDPQIGVEMPRHFIPEPPIR
jgi:hypothetical protein